jgi:A/G-specific adenine glycosylase
MKTMRNSASLETVAASRPEAIQWMRRRVLRWGRVHYRHFPWRDDRNPYRSLVTEVLLKQTRAAQVGPVREALLRKYPIARRLADADADDLSTLIRSLGFAAQRGPQLTALGRALTRLGRTPRSIDGLLAIPGVGPYAASAVACFAFGRREAAVDVNVARIISRFFWITPKRGELRKNAEIIGIASGIVSRGSPREINWALLDLGAEVCRPKPRCPMCPLASRCRYNQRSGQSPKGTTPMTDKRGSHQHRISGERDRRGGQASRRG